MPPPHAGVHAAPGDFSPGNVKELLDARGCPAMQPHPLRDASATPPRAAGEAGEPESSLALCLPWDEAHHQHPGAKGQRHRIHAALPFGSGGYSMEVANVALDSRNRDGAGSSKL